MSPYRYSVIPFHYNEKIVSLFQNSPKVYTGPVLPRVLRKGQIALLKVFEAIKAVLEIQKIFNILDEVSPPRVLYVPQLPHPPFRSVKPPRYFWREGLEVSKDDYAAPCLMSDTPENGPVLIKSSQRLMKRGILRQDDEGYVYLELPESLAAQVFSLIGTEAVRDEFVHIPVILPQEWEQKKGLGAIKELGNSLAFEMNGLYSQRPKSWPGVEKVYFLRVPSSQLESLREKYLLPSKIRGHDFHAVIALKHGFAPKQNETFRLNVSCFAA